MKIPQLATILIAIGVLSSCVTIYFDQPQPVDAKDLRKAPKAIRGFWTAELDTVIITKREFYWVQWYTDTLDLAEIEADTNLEIQGDLLYDRTELPAVAYKCIPMDASCYVFVPDRIEYGIADTALLRKVNRDFYTFNLTSDGKWWEVFLVERTGKGALSVWYPGRTDVCLMEVLDAGEEMYIPEDDDPGTVFTNDFHKFWQVELTRTKLLECYGLGAFGELLLELKAEWKQ